MSTIFADGQQRQPGRRVRLVDHADTVLENAAPGEAYAKELASQAKRTADVQA